MTTQQEQGHTPKQHNPDNLTPEQWGAADGWRLLDEDEILNHYEDGHKYLPILSQICAWAKFTKYWIPINKGCDLDFTYRTRLTRAELRAARGLEPEKEVQPDAGEKNLTPSEAVRILMIHDDQRLKDIAELLRTLAAERDALLEDKADLRNLLDKHSISYKTRP